MRDCCSPSCPCCTPPHDGNAWRDWQQCFLFFPSSYEFACAPRFGLGEMKYNGGGPGAWWGDVSTEGKQLFVCLSLTLGLPFISLQGCRAVFTPGSLFLLLPLPFLYPLLFMPSLKALLDDHQGLPLKLSSPIFVYLVVIIQTLPQVQRTHSRVSCVFYSYICGKGLGELCLI